MNMTLFSLRYHIIGAIIAENFLGGILEDIMQPLFAMQQNLMGCCDIFKGIS